jgi:predicted RNA-binding protein
MNYYIDLFSPETAEAFSRSGRNISGFRKTQWNIAKKVLPGDIFVCYMTRVSRWFGLLEVIEGPFEENTPIFTESDDPFVVRFKVREVVWLDVEHAIPIHEDQIWNKLSFTKGHDKKSAQWTGRVRTSLGQSLEENDAKIICGLLKAQVENPRIYELSDKDKRALKRHSVRRIDKTITVSVPTDSEHDEEPTPEPEVRESIAIQAKLAYIGAAMGMKLWVPRNDRSRVLIVYPDLEADLLNQLPLNYDETTLTTIENIDLLWLKGRSIMRAFEIEHTTSVYSGILRMADLLALQPNMNIKLHIVAPATRRDKVFQELTRPVFSLLERAPLHETCTYLSYESVQELGELDHLQHLSDSVLDEYAENAEDSL